MRFKSLVSTIGITSAFLLSTFMMSCTSKITEEQLQQLQDLRRREANLQDQIRSVESDNSRLESEVNSRRSEADNCADEREFVQQKLSQWPNVWPDYKPEEPGE